MTAHRQPKLLCAFAGPIPQALTPPLGYAYFTLIGNGKTVGFWLQSDEPLEHALWRIAVEQLNGAVSDLDNTQYSAHDKVHEVRKRCKRLRGLLRLVRPALAEYPKANAWVRDMSRDLSLYRDNQAVIETLDALLKADQPPCPGLAASPFRAALLAQRDSEAGASKNNVQQALKQVNKALKRARQEIRGWQLEKDKPQVWLMGLRDTYCQGRHAMARAVRTPSAEHLHEWRKQAKYHWFHLQLLENLWPAMLVPWAQQVHLLSDLLGDEHDLAVLQMQLDLYCQQCPNDQGSALLFERIEKRRAELVEKACALGQRIYAERPKALAKRFAAYQQAWQKQTDKGA